MGDTKVEAVEVNRMKLGEPDFSGRRRPEIENGSEYKIEADIVINQDLIQKIFQNCLMQQS